MPSALQTFLTRARRYAITRAMHGLGVPIAFLLPLPFLFLGEFLSWSHRVRQCLEWRQEQSAHGLTPSNYLWEATHE
jgi:hypothetical protein